MVSESQIEWRREKRVNPKRDEELMKKMIFERRQSYRIFDS